MRIWAIISRKSAKEEGTKQSQKRNVSADAKVIWALHKEQPLSFEKLAEKAGISISTLYRDIPALTNYGYIRDLTDRSTRTKGIFVLSDYKTQDELIIRMRNLAFLDYLTGEEKIPLRKCIESTLDDIGLIGMDPKDPQVRKRFFQVFTKYINNLEKHLPQEQFQIFKKKGDEALKKFREQYWSAISENQNK